MPRYQFTAETLEGFVVQGELLADSHDAAMAQLIRQKLHVRRLDRAGAASSVRLTADELNFFNRQLAGLAEAQLPLAPAFRELARDARGGRLAEAFSRLADDLAAGRTLSEAVEAHRSAFPPLYGRMIQAGVDTGNLAGVLMAVDRHEAILRRMRRAVAESLAYPAVVLLWAALLVVFLGQFVMPHIRGMMADIQQFQPTPFWFNLSCEVLGNAHWLFLCIVGIGLLGYLALRLLPSPSDPAWPRIRWGMFLFGRVYRDASRAQLCDTVAMALAAGRDVGDALFLAGGALPDGPMRHEACLVADQFRQGQLTEGVIDELEHLPALLLWGIEVAGPRGDVVATCQRLASMYADRAESAARFVRLIIAPISILLVGSLVAGVLVGLYAPLVHLIRSVTSGVG